MVKVLNIDSKMYWVLVIMTSLAVNYCIIVSSKGVVIMYIATGNQGLLMT